MVLKLAYHGETSVPVELQGLTPDWACLRSPAEIERFEIFHGNQKLPLAEFFRVSGDASDKVVEFDGSLSGVHWIGAGMESGEIRIHGSAGRHVGSEMHGGQITVEGNTSDWVGAEMRGGRIRIQGSVGHLAGSGYRGSTRGMTGGEILINGDAGNEIGLAMRRGLIAIRGSAGEFVGGSMIAGSILVLGNCGKRPGAGMRRGTLALFGSNPPPLLPTFCHGATFKPQWVSLLLRHLQSNGFAVDQSLLSATYDLYQGDFVTLGRGEILLRNANG